MRTSGAPVDAGYVIARNTLLDALAALAPYGREAVIVVGAQAVYLRCEEVRAIGSPFTTLFQGLTSRLYGAYA